jgi:4-amino-4-deoxy-L-arabinose transferase-like glycosyltransferase
MTTPRDTYTPRLDVIAFVIILASFAVRYWFVATGQLNLVQDEAQYWDWIRRPQLSYYSKGPLIAWVITAWTQVFGNTELGVRFGSVIGMTGIQAALYVGVSRVWKRHSLAVYVLFVAATMPLLNGLGVLATTDNPLILCWTVAFFALSAATRNDPDTTPSNWPFVILAVCIAVGTLAKYMMLAFLGLAVIHCLILHLRGQMPRRFWARFLLASLVGTAAGLTPIVLWNMDNDWVAYKHVAKLSSSGPGKHSGIRFLPFLEMLGAQIGLFAPWWFLFTMTGSWAAFRKSWIGPVGRFDAAYRHGLQALLYFWPLWGIITFKAIFSKVEANWTAAGFMAGALLGGMALKGWWESPQRQFRGRAILAGLAMLLMAMTYLSPLAPVPDNLNPTHRLKGWADLGRKVGQLRQTEFSDPGRVFVFSDNYGITSELAFYVPGQPITYCSWTEMRRMNQYDLWPDPGQERVGWDAVMIRARDEEGTPTALASMFESVSEPMDYQTTFKDGPGRRFTVILCKGFTGTWPRLGLGKY